MTSEETGDVPIEDAVEEKSSCCCCCRRTNKQDKRDRQRLNGQRPSSYTETLTPIVGDSALDAKSFQNPVTKQESVQREQQKSKKCAHRCLKCCKKFTTFFFSNVGLCSAVVAYSILGGFIFRDLESPHERLKRHEVNSKRGQYVEELYNFTKTQKYFHKPNYTRDTEEILKRFQVELLAAKSAGWDGSDDNAEPQWSFAGSLLYSVTVITTIGYGHIAPQTVNGRLVTIFYALFGIPLTLLCLANMGSFMGNCFRLLYKHFCRLCTWLCCPADESFTRRKKTMQLRQKEMQALTPTITIDNNGKDGNTLKVAPSSSRSTSRAGSSTEINIIVDDYEPVKVKQRVEDIRVPIFVSLLIITLYIFGGALMFSMWEEWDYLEASYFCFITLSTIGFGDYVPGSLSRTDSSDSRQKLIICCVYLMFGLSLIAMCFNLMQEDVRAKFIWLGQKVGLIDKRKK